MLGVAAWQFVLQLLLLCVLILSDAAENDAYLPDDVTVTEADDVMGNLQKWLSEGGARLANIEFRTVDGVRGAYAAADIQQQQIIVQIPLNKTITASMGRATAMGQAIVASVGAEEASYNFGILYVALFILEDMKSGNSSFMPYYDALPTAYDNMPLFWGPDKMAWLTGTYTAVDAQHQYDYLRRTYDWFVAIHPPFAAVASSSEFLWAYAVSRTRTFEIPLTSDATTHAETLVPYADMLNHWLPCASQTELHHPTTSFIFRAKTTLEAGTELCASYGQRQKRDYLQHFGFILDDNFEKGGCTDTMGADDEAGAPPDCTDDTELEFALDANDPLLQRKQHLLPARPSNGVGHWDASGPFLPLAAGAPECSSSNAADCAVSTLPTPARGSWRLALNGRKAGALGSGMGLLRLACVKSEKELAQMEADAWASGVGVASLRSGALSVETEACSLQRLGALAQAYIRGYPSTLEEDSELINGGTLAPFSDRRNALVLTVVEKGVLHDIQQVTAAALKCLPQSDGACTSPDERRRQQDAAVLSLPASLHQLVRFYCDTAAAALHQRNGCGEAHDTDSAMQDTSFAAEL
eukprot:TRINITY_DN6258_c1_g1_i1.p1 TRINITY_DN6258_c1_g1~~TRINITY_DN6258_c1_g1_i1.p1  ORF type:complete len:598 (+),score=137.05 TRINITY_DN6258_c1_g1_i1:46-1794(+)